MESVENDYAIVLEDYTAKELNGWLWCVKLLDRDEGWLPKEKLRSY